MSLSKRSRLAAHARPHGPRTIEGVLRLPETYCTVFSSGGQLRTIKRLEELDVVGTSNYSGTGAFELGLFSTLANASVQAGCRGPKCTMYSASDISGTMRAVLLSHAVSTRPKHLFGCILERLHAECNFTY